MFTLNQVLMENNEAASTEVASVVFDALPMTTMTLAEHQQVFERIVIGELTSADIIRECFERLVRDRLALAAELGKLKKDDIAKRIAGYVRPEYKKHELVDQAINTMMNSYGFVAIPKESFVSGGYTLQSHIDNNRKRLSKLTDEVVTEYREKHQQARQEKQLRAQAIIDAIKDPQTIDQFETFFRVKGKDKLTVDQQLRYDTLVSSKLKEKQSVELAKLAVIEGVSVEADVEMIATKHTRDGHDLFVVKLSRRVEREEYMRLNAACRRLSGYYSNYRLNGAIPGFQFKSQENAEHFMQICKGETVDNSENADQRAEQKLEQTAERLRELGERKEEKAEDLLHRDRKTNTARRAAIASRIESVARSEIAVAQTVQNLANAMEAGQLEHLTGLRHQNQVELLNRILRNAKDRELRQKYPEYRDYEQHKGEAVTEATVYFVEYPTYIFTENYLRESAKKLGAVNGMKRKASFHEQVANHFAKKGAAAISLESLDETCERLGFDARFMPYQWASVADDRRQLKKMGLHTDAQLRMACRELVAQLAEKAQADKATELERKLIGSNVGIDFFPTPSHLAQRMVQIAGVKVGKTALEPHGGNGMIAGEIRAAGVEPDVCEISWHLREILQAKKFNVVHWDFLEWQDKKYDCIIANPPFSNNQDIVHTRHAYSLLNEDGCLSTIVGEGAFHRAGKIEGDFRAWLDEVGAEVEKLPEGTFTDGKLMVNTSANARLVTIRR